MGILDSAAGGTAFGPWGTVIGAGIGLVGSLFGAHSQSKANKEAITFQKQQAQNSYLNNEVSRRANYDIWAARERRLASIGQALGYAPREIPAYAPGIDPMYATPTLVQRVQLSKHPLAGSIGSYF